MCIYTYILCIHGHAVAHIYTQSSFIFSSQRQMLKYIFYTSSLPVRVGERNGSWHVFPVANTRSGRRMPLQLDGAFWQRGSPSDSPTSFLGKDHILDSTGIGSSSGPPEILASSCLCSILFDICLTSSCPEQTRYRRVQSKIPISMHRHR